MIISKSKVIVGFWDEWLTPLYLSHIRAHKSQINQLEEISNFSHFYHDKLITQERK